jgi:hypothetical protein
MKSPGLPSWKKYQKESTAGFVEGWWGPGSDYIGIWTCTGSVSGLVVLDCDSAEADAFWRSLPGMAAAMDATTCVKTSKGFHYWFAIAPNSKVKSWAYHEGVISFDVKAEGGGVMTPPSPHPDGGFYSWVREPSELLPAPSWVSDGGKGALARIADPSAKEDNGEATEDKSLESPRVSSLLSELLENPPDAGGRNEWLIRVAGHYAKTIPWEHAYEATMRLANSALKEPLGEAEFLKTVASAWNMEQAKTRTTVEALREQGFTSGEPDSENGWLMGTGNKLMCPSMHETEDGRKVETLVEFADFDIQVLGIVKGADSLDFLVLFMQGSRTVEREISGACMGSMRELLVWLAKQGGTFSAPVGDRHPKLSPATRLLRYLRSQGAPVYKSIKALGWDDEAAGFITHEGIIRAGATEPLPFADQRPAPILREWAPYRYGFAGSRKDAIEVLREVMTFHEETVCAVYGSWWAACFLKQQIMGRTALFPFMALEAPSESGKTTGFFSLLMQLAGNYEGHGEYTIAVLRDRVSAHFNGPVWVDDVTNPGAVLDLIRQATSGGSRSKKGENRHSQETVELVAPIAISAEGLQALSTEKALSDRAIRLTVPSPVGRRSLHDATRPQWDDITNLQSRYKRDLSQIAGHMASMALECLPMVEGMTKLRPDGGGRFADTMMILRFGSRVLESMGVSGVIERTDAWVEQRVHVYDPSANLLTKQILPWAWRDLGYPRSCKHGTPVFLDNDGSMWYREEKLADMWAARREITDRERQLGSLDSMRDQRRRLWGIEGNGQRLRVGEQQLRYQRLSAIISEPIVEAAGWSEGPEDGKML